MGRTARSDRPRQFSTLSFDPIYSIIAPLWGARAARAEGTTMGIFDIVSVTTFWKILLFVHFVLAVGLLAAVTLQSVAVLMPARQLAGTFLDHFRPVPAASFAKLIVFLYVPNFLMGVWLYIKYRTYVRIPMEQEKFWWTVGAFEFKEHIISMGLALLPAYWYFWQEPQSDEHARVRTALTLFLAVAVWYSFLSGHVANDFRGVGS
jgi:hypothetical protein